MPKPAARDQKGNTRSRLPSTSVHTFRNRGKEEELEHSGRGHAAARARLGRSRGSCHYSAVSGTESSLSEW